MLAISATAAAADATAAAIADAKKPVFSPRRLLGGFKANDAVASAAVLSPAAIAEAAEAAAAVAHSRAPTGKEAELDHVKVRVGLCLWRLPDVV